MGSNHGSDRDQTPKRRRGLNKRRARPSLEGLETRQLLSIGNAAPLQPTNNNLADVKQGPLARAGQQLLTIYQEYQGYLARNDQGQFQSSQARFVEIRGTSVGLDVSGVGDFSALQTTLRNQGMQITGVDTTRRIVEGFLPISQLPTIAVNPQVSGILPIFKPFFNSVGSASNQGERVLKADTARTTFNVTGAGVKVGVLSDSVSRYDNPNVPGTGLTESVTTGDLPDNVQVIQDEAAGGNNSDEGRAMLEQIYDIAPGASLAFATATGGEINFANNIRALALAGARVIVDDVGYFAEPMFQDGIVSQAVTDVVKNNNASYFSSAGNEANGGYQSDFRGVNATVGGLSGRWMNFNPNGGTQTTLPVTVRAAGAPVIFQWDNPYYVTNGVTSDLDIYFLDASGNIVAQSQTNNILQGTPLEIIGLPANAASMAIRVNPGSPDVGRVGVIVLGDAARFDTTFGGAGGTTYATTFGHPTATEAIGVGAVPWWLAPPFSTASSIPAETFSSFGPATILFNADGSRKGAVEVRQKPDVSGPDGNDTSFFIPGFLLRTLTPPFNDPASPTELDGNALPNFFGTSSSAPNLAAVAALMKQLAPGATQTDIRNAMIASALPLNGSTRGAWDVQGGYGLVQTDAALSAIDTLRVVTVTPAPGSTLTSSPSQLIVTFSRPINAGTLQNTDLNFTLTPPNTAITVGTPVLINATTVAFPLNFTTQPGTKANGSFAYTLVDRSITSTDGRLLAGYSAGFALSDATAPKVTGTTLVGRTVAIQFSESMRPDTINAASVVLYRQIKDSLGNVIALDTVSVKPGAVVFYDVATNRAIIDLTQVSQDNLPSGTYIIQVRDSVTDLVGNRLDGEFYGAPPSGNNNTFPSGDNNVLPLEDFDNDTFNQVIPNLVLTAPRVVSLGLDQTAGPVPVNPRVVGTLYNRQAIEVYFSQAMNPATITKGTVLLLRSNGRGLDFTAPIQVASANLTVRYDNVANKAVIDLSRLTDVELPADTYLVAVTTAAADLQGDRIDGEFSWPESFNPDVRRSLFPSGDGKLGAAEQNDNDTFIQLIPDLATSGPARFTRYDSGILGDNNTNFTRPVLSGQVSNGFPGAIGGLTVVAQFNALHNGTLDLNTGVGGRGFVGNPDLVTTTDANGRFTIVAPTDLPDGFNTVRVVVLGQADAPPLPGLSARIDTSFRIDTTKPQVTSSLLPGTLLSSFTTVSLNVVDPIQPQNQFDPLVVPTQLSLPALDPATANNISNYSLVNLGADSALGGTGANADQDLARYITSASFVATTSRTRVTDPYTGRIDIAIAPGLPAGHYVLIARRPQPGYAGITDAAGNPIDGDPSKPGAQDFQVDFFLQSQPVFITGVKALSPLPSGGPVVYTDPTTYVASDPRAFFEVAVPGNTPRATAPPTDFFVDFSTSLNPSLDYSNAIQLIRSANSAGAAADGDFGVDSSFTSGQGSTRVTGLTVTLVSSDPSAGPGQPGYNNRLVVRLPLNTNLAPDNYRLFLPNSGVNTIVDAFGNQLDGEFLGDRDGKGGFETLLPNGQYRTGLSGDGVAGGAFETGYVVVPNGNIIYARPDYVDSPFLTSDDPDGSLAKPYPALAPEAQATAANGGNLNSVVNFGTGFDARLDRNQNRHFDRSALYAASIASARGPVVVVALPAAAQRDPATGITTQQTFVLAAPGGTTDPVRNNASASVPFLTTLVFNAGSTLKLQNSSLYVQNQGSALQIEGGADPSQRVNFTSFSDDSVGGDTNGDGAPGAGGNAPGGGDWGAVVFRNYDQTGRTNLNPFPVDGRLKGPNNGDARSGADDAMSEINFASLRFGGGPVPRTLGEQNGPVTFFNSRPALTNTSISDSRLLGTTVVTGTVGAITADFDSFREDELARGPLIRRVDVVNNSINGIFIRATLAGQARQTNAIRYPDNGAAAGGSRNFVIDDPLPHVLTTRLVIGEEEQVNTGGTTVPVTNRLYVQPGMMFKMPTGSAIDLVTQGASVNIGDRTYINQFDANPNFAPTDASFRNNTTGDAKVLFTSYYDDVATTVYRDPNTGALTTIVPAIDTDSGGNIFQPTQGNVPASARWGGISIQSGVVGVIDEAEFRYGGGSVNIPSGTINQRDVLAFQVTVTPFVSSYDGFNKTVQNAFGMKVKVTNNDFFDNNQAPMEIDPNGLLAADPLRPLLSGNPFFRGNILQRNGLNGLEVRGPFTNSDGLFFVGYPSNLEVDSVWDDTDLTYVLRTTIVLAGAFGFNFGTFGSDIPTPGSSFGPELKPFIGLTVQSNLPDTLLADGTRIARPGEGALVKMLNPALPIAGDGVNGFAVGGNPDSLGGAGFLVGVDDGVDPAGNDPLPDPGLFSQLRFVGIGGNETTGQQRVPVTLTSLRDDTVGRTVRGVDMFQTISGNTTAPAPGDAGVIGIGGLSLPDPNLYDPRDGSIIDNADIRYLTRIDVQNNDVIFRSTLVGTAQLDKLGSTPATQFNQPMAVAITNSNLSSFSQVGVIAQANGFDAIQITVDPTTGQASLGARTPANITGSRGRGILLNLTNNVITNMPVAVRAVAESVNNTQGASPNQLLFLNNTFAGNPIGIDLQAQEQSLNPPNTLAHNYILVMDNIFEGATTAAVRIAGMSYSSQGQYNLFSNSVPLVRLTTGPWTQFNNANAILGSALFRDPANGDYSLLPGSDAIDRGLSELGEVEAGIAVKPRVNQALNSSGGTYNGTTANPRGGLAFPTASDIVTLPGFPDRTFYDQWVAALPGSPGALPGPATTTGNFWYMPIGGERDQLGFLRVDDPTNPRIGAGSRPYYDIGALERRIIIPPHVTDVQAVFADPTSPTGVRSQNFYTVGGAAGSRNFPLELRIKTDTRLDPSTVNNRTVILQAAGGNGIFGDANNANDRTIDLSGKLRYDAATQTIVIDLSGVQLSLGDDQYRLTLFGNGQDVIRDPQGNALDAENTVGNVPTGAQLILPSGNGIPGGNFYLRFDIDSTPSAIVPRTLRLDASSDTGRPGDALTSSNRPSFSGQIQDATAPANGLGGQTVIIDLAGPDNTFGTADDVLNAGTGLTTPAGTFLVTVGTDAGNTGLVKAGTFAPDSRINVGPDGYLGPNPLTGQVDDDLTTYSLARVRVVDPSGNASDPTAIAGLVRFGVDTQGPRITGVSPLPGAAAAANGGLVPVTLIVNENVDISTVNPTTVRVARAGGDNIFGNANDVPLTITGLQLTPLKNAQGSMQIQFNIAGAAANDLYRVTLVGSASGVRDWVGNALDGETAGSLPSGNGAPGGDFNLDFVVFDAANPRRTLFVDDNATPSANATGSKANPFSSIMDRTLPGPDNVLGTADDVQIRGAMSVAGVGDTIAVLPGTYNESVVLKSLVHLVSASLSSTDTTLIPGQALQTVIRPIAPTNGVTIGVSATNLFSLPNFSTELAGFTILIPLSGDTASGPINSSSYGILAQDSDILIDKNYVVNAGYGIVVSANGVGTATPRIESNGLIGNTHGVLINAANAVTFRNGPTRIANNTFAFNNIGLLTLNSPSFSQSVLATVDNNIFANNFTGSTSRTGTGILAATPTILTLRGNLFSNNGVSVSRSDDDVLGTVGSAFNPSLLGNTPDANGNFVGNPGFANPRDPRSAPQGQGPAVFFLDANFDLTGASAAIDNAWNSLAPTRDFRSRSRVDIPNVGRVGYGPADIGAFEYRGTGGISGIGGSGTVLSAALTTTPVVNSSGFSTFAATSASSLGTNAGGGPAITVHFSQPVDRTSVQTTDLVLTGSLDSLNPAHAASLSWIDDQTVAFNLAGSFGNGSVTVEVPEGAVLGRDGTPLQGYSTTIAVNNPAATPAALSIPAAVTVAAPAAASVVAATTTPSAPAYTTAPPPVATPHSGLTSARARRSAAWARFLSRRRIHN